MFWRPTQPKKIVLERETGTLRVGEAMFRVPVFGEPRSVYVGRLSGGVHWSTKAQIVTFCEATLRCNPEEARAMRVFRTCWQEEQGQDLIEYTLLMAFVALASAALVIGQGGSIKGIWSVTNSQLAAASTQAS